MVKLTTEEQDPRVRMKINQLANGSFHFGLDRDPETNYGANPTMRQASGSGEAT